MFCCCYGSGPSRQGLIIVTVPWNERARGTAQCGELEGVCTTSCPGPCRVAMKGCDALAKGEVASLFPGRTLKFRPRNTARFSLASWLYESRS